MLQSWKTFINRFVTMTIIGALAMVPAMADAHETRSAPRILRVGTLDAPPFAIKTEDGRWEGLSIELCRAIARDLKFEYGLVECDSLDMVLRRFEKKELDVFPALADGITLREPINRELLKITGTKEWDLLMKRYIGPDF